MGSSKDYDKLAKEQRRPGTLPVDGTLDYRELIRHAALAASSHNTQPGQFYIEQGAITIEADFSRCCPVVDPDDRHLFQSLGCAAENLVHAAAAQGFSADPRFDPSRDRIVVVLNRDASLSATDLYGAITKRQCVRTDYDGTAIGESALRQLRQAGQGPTIRMVMLLSETQKDTVIDYVMRGDRAQLTDRAYRNELVSWIRFNPGAALRTGDGLSGRSSGLPALPTGLAERLSGLLLSPHKQANTSAAHIRSSAGVAVFVSRRGDKAAWVEAGRAYERFALQATVLNISNAFINQPIEVPALRPRFESWLNLKGEHALLMARFGYGRALPFSLRRPLDDMIVAAGDRGTC